MTLKHREFTQVNMLKRVLTKNFLDQLQDINGSALYNRRQSVQHRPNTRRGLGGSTEISRSLIKFDNSEADFYRRKEDGEASDDEDWECYDVQSSSGSPAGSSPRSTDSSERERRTRSLSTSQLVSMQETTEAGEEEEADEAPRFQRNYNIREKIRRNAPPRIEEASNDHGSSVRPEERSSKYTNRGLFGSAKIRVQPPSPEEKPRPKFWPTLLPKTDVSLWCRQQKVVESGILEQMPDVARNLQEALYEYIVTERNNLAYLDILANYFRANLLAENNEHVLSPYESNALFYKLDELLDCTKKLVKKIDELQGDELLIRNYLNYIAEAVEKKHGYGAYYIKYCSHLSECEKILGKLNQDKLLFKQKVKELEEEDILENKVLKIFIVSPMNRTCHIPLLIEKIIKSSAKVQTPYAEDINQSAKRALEKFKWLASQCNQEARMKEDLAKQQILLVELSRKLLFPCEIELNVVTASRRFLYETNATEIIEDPNGIFLKYIEKQVHFKLFNDSLMICRQATPQGIFVVLDVVAVKNQSIFISEYQPKSQQPTPEDSPEEDEVFKAPIANTKYLKDSEISFLSNGHKSRKPIGLMCFRTKLDDHIQSKYPKKEQRKSTYRKYPNCYSSEKNENKSHIFILPPQNRDVFLKNLRSAVQAESNLYLLDGNSDYSGSSDAASVNLHEESTRTAVQNEAIRYVAKSQNEAFEDTQLRRRKSSRASKKEKIYTPALGENIVEMSGIEASGLQMRSIANGDVLLPNHE